MFVVVLFLLLATSGFTQADFFGITKEQIGNFAKAIRENISGFFLGVSPNTVKFLLYKNCSDEPLELAAKNATEHINTSFESFFIIHGWFANGKSPWVKELAHRLHKVGQFNVIAVDWSILALADYFGAVRSLSAVGYRVKDFIESQNITINTTQIIGHSLGGQVASFVAKGLGQSKVKQIVGLDPAGPLFDWPIFLPQDYRLSSDDATTVQVIHTSKIVRGVTITCGTIDFYVNDGANQPGCTGLFKATCSHSLSHTYYILTINDTYKYPGTKLCSSDDFERDSKNVAYMGYGFDRKHYGIYNVKTNATKIDFATKF